MYIIYLLSELPSMKDLPFQTPQYTSGESSSLKVPLTLPLVKFYLSLIYYYFLAYFVNWMTDMNAIDVLPTLCRIVV